MQKKMTSAEINVRLAEIEDAQAAHRARDFDAELKGVMLAGGDLDSLEEAQLEAERQARRLRVEKQALEAILPDTEKAEALVEIEKLAQGMEGHIDRFREAAHAIAKLLKQATDLEEESIEINKARCAAHVAAKRLVNKYSLPADALEPFRRLKTSLYPFKNDHGFAEGVDIWEYMSKAIEID